MCVILGEGEILIFDSDVLIWFFRSSESAKKIIRENVPFSISIVTYMEILQGALNKKELLDMKKFFRDTNTTIIPIDETISFKAAEYVERYTLSDAMELADALIAATAIENEEVLCTGNEKHYKCVPNLKMSIFKA